MTSGASRRSYPLAALAVAPLILGGGLVVLAEACSSSSVTCGPGTELSGSTCVVAPGSSSASSASSTSGSSTASSTSGSSGTGGNPTTSSSSSSSSSSSAGTGGSSSHCTTQCDCLSGTVCAVGGTCEVPPSGLGACDQTCQTNTDCTCGSCDNGVCVNPAMPKYAGSGAACQMDCDCPGSSGWSDQCIGGRCVRPCDIIGPQCVDDSQCSGCSEMCLGNGVCGKPGACFGGTDCLSFPGELCTSSMCAPPPGTRYATSSTLPAGAVSMTNTIPLSVPVPSGVTVNDVVVVVDVTISNPDPGAGPVTLQGPDGTMVTLAQTFVGTSGAKNGVTRMSYPTMGAFKGKAATGTWTFTISAAGSYQVDDLALYIQ